MLSIQRAMAFLARRMVRLPGIPADIMNTDSMTLVTNVLKSKCGLEENQHIKTMYVCVLVCSVQLFQFCMFICHVGVDHFFQNVSNNHI